MSSSAKFELRQIAGKLLKISEKLEGKLEGKVDKKEKFEKRKSGGKTKKVDMKERMRLMREMRGKSKTQKMKIMKENNWKGGKEPVAEPVADETEQDAIETKPDADETEPGSTAKPDAIIDNTTETETVTAPVAGGRRKKDKK